MRPAAGRVGAVDHVQRIWFEPWMPGRQVAWLRRADGGWLALVLVPAASTNQAAHVTLQLWVEPDAIDTDAPR